MLWRNKRRMLWSDESFDLIFSPTSDNLLHMKKFLGRNLINTPSRFSSVKKLKVVMDHSLKPTS